MVYAIIGCLFIIGFIIGFLGYKLYQKQQINYSELNEYKAKVIEAQEKYKDESAKLNLVRQNLDSASRALTRQKEETEYEKHKLEECRKDLQAALEVYQDITDNKLKEIDASIEEQRQKRQEELEQTILAQDALLTQKKEATEKEIQEAQLWCNNEVARIVNESKEKIAEYEVLAAEAEEKYIGLLEPLKQYEKNKQAKLFYTIQFPEEYHEDIEFLLTTVAAKVQHPDIISKLVWSEYVKPNLDNTFKRIEIKSEPGIYKLTSLENGMSYIGKSTDVKKRIADHFKSSIGIRSIADQAVHHAILKEGFWNWAIEIITYADKEKLNELEKYYIEFFKTQEFGYNKNSGGGG